MNSSAILSLSTDALVCLAYLVGIVAGVIALTRKQTRLGILATVAFFLLGMAIVAREVLVMVALPAIMRANGDYATYSWLSFCIETPLILIGVILLVVLVFTAINKRATKSVAGEELPPAP